MGQSPRNNETNTVPSKSEYVISVLAHNSVGIFSQTCAAITDTGGNITALSQTVVQGYFTILIAASYADAPSTDAVRHWLFSHLKEDVENIAVTPQSEVAKAEEDGSHGHYIITLIGNDFPGLLKFVASHVEALSCNITDWYIEFYGRTVTHIGEITVPSEIEVNMLQERLSEALKGKSLRCSVQHINLFRATNEIGPLRTLLKASLHAQ